MKWIYILRIRTDVIELLPATFRTVTTVADAPGTWLLHCHVIDHQMAGMDALYRIQAPLGISNATTTTVEPLTLSKELVSKTAMNAPAAPKPPKAAPLLSLNEGRRGIQVDFMSFGLFFGLISLLIV